MVAAKNAVEAPTNITTLSAVCDNSNSGDRRATMNTPAVTMVAAWMSAETGVGPSIASGSQVCRPSWADLPMAPTNSSRQMMVGACHSWPRNMDVLVRSATGAEAKTCSKATEPVIRNTAKMPSAKPKSPTRLTTKALIAAAHWPTASRTRSRSAGRRRGRRPPSRRTAGRGCPLVTSISMAKVKSER